MTDTLDATDGVDLEPLPSGDATRMAVVKAAIAAFREYAFHEVTFALVLADCDVEVADVRKQFPTWESLLISTIDLWNSQRMRPILPVAEQHGAVAFLRSVILANLADPDLMRLLSATVNIAATPGHAMAGFLQHEWLRFHALVQRTLMRDVEIGREQVDLEPGRATEQLIALYEGLQLQAMVRPGMNLVAAYDRAVERLRDGWAGSRIDLVWEV